MLLRWNTKWGWVWERSPWELKEWGNSLWRPLWEGVFHTQWTTLWRFWGDNISSVFRKQQRDSVSLPKWRAGLVVHLWSLGDIETERLQTRWRGFLLCFANKEKKIRRQRGENRHIPVCFLLFFLVSSSWFLSCYLIQAFAGLVSCISS